LAARRDLMNIRGWDGNEIHANKARNLHTRIG
jgi:hypothetical protein